MVAVSCILYIGMGLHDAVSDVLGVRIRITGCPKCLTYWSVLAYCLLSGCRFVPSMFAAFSLAYCALWASLLLDALAKLYNNYYDKNQTDDTQESEAQADDSTVS